MKNMATGFALTAFLLLLGLFYVFTERYLSAQHNPNARVDASGGTLVLQMARDGHYRVGGTVNGQPVVFFLDTGATHVSINQDLATALDVSRGAAVPISTANGVVTGYRTHLAQLAFAGYAFTDVPALIMPNMGGEVLLGMSILQQFQWRQANGTLTLSAETR